MFCVCNCGSKKLEALKIKYDKEKETWNFFIGCSKCKKTDSFQVHNDYLMSFLTCQEIVTAFGPMKKQGTEIRQERLW